LEHFLFSIFFHNIWDVILPIDFHIFQRGRSTTNQNKNSRNIPWEQHRVKTSENSGIGSRTKWQDPPVGALKKNMLFDEDPNQIPRRYD
jgi:hypothetical protein